MATYLTYEYVHLTRYFSKGIDGNGPFYRVEYFLNDWADTDGFLNALLGKATGSSGSVVRTSPHPYPLSTNLFCVSAEVVEGVGKPSLNVDGYPQYAGGAIIRAEYRALTLDITPNPGNSFDPSTPIAWATQELDFATETYTAPHWKYFYSSGPHTTKALNLPVKIVVPITTMVLTFMNLPYLPMTVVRSRRGRVNNATFLNAAAGCVLFEGAKSSRTFNTDGTVCQSVQLVFKERDPLNKWNWMPDQDGAWYPVEAPISGAKLFLEDDLSPLLTL